LNSLLRLVRRWSPSIIRFVWRERFTWVWDLPDKGRYMKYSCLGGVICHNLKKKKKNFSTLLLIVGYLAWYVYWKLVHQKLSMAVKSSSVSQLFSIVKLCSWHSQLEILFVSQNHICSLVMITISNYGYLSSGKYSLRLSLIMRMTSAWVK
jgi:hypothetical protein